MCAGFEGNVERTFFQNAFVFYVTNGFNFGVRFAVSGVISFGNNFVVVHDYASHHGVGSHGTHSIQGKVEGYLHVFFVTHSANLSAIPCAAIHAVVQAA